MRILVSGHAGFLGRHFARRFVDQGHSVTGIDLRSGESVGVQRSLVADFGDWARSSQEKFDLVVHMAGAVGGRAVIENDSLHNAEGLRLDAALFRWATKHAGTVVYPSSSAVYG